jgi:L-asparaginase II
MSADILAKVIRGSAVESIHRGHLIILSGEGHTVHSAGNPKTVTYIRSSAKPFQAVPFITSGACDEWDFSEEELALACASHSGERIHVRIAEQMLARIEMYEAYLRCGAHLPFNEKEAERMMREGEPPTQLHNNCSGKHAAMLAVAKLLEADLQTYEERDHPVQQAILEAVSAFTEVPVKKIKIGVDGCAAPNFALPVEAMARGFLNLVSPPAEMDEKLREAAARITSAMVKFPELIGGAERLDTMLMQAAPDRIISKVGADGVWLCAVLPDKKWPRGLAIALKIEDGDDRRARPVVAVEVLRQLGILSADALPEVSPMAIKNRRGDVVGEVVATVSVAQA